MGMTKTIRMTDRDNGNLWGDRLKPTIAGRAVAAVMSDLQYVGAQIGPALYHIYLSLLSRIGGEEKPRAAIDQLKHQAAVVIAFTDGFQAG